MHPSGLWLMYTRRLCLACDRPVGGCGNHSHGQGQAADPARPAAHSPLDPSDGHDPHTPSVHTQRRHATHAEGKHSSAAAPTGSGVRAAAAQQCGEAPDEAPGAHLLLLLLLLPARTPAARVCDKQREATQEAGERGAGHTQPAHAHARTRATLTHPQAQAVTVRKRASEQARARRPLLLGKCSGCAHGRRARRGQYHTTRHNAAAARERHAADTRTNVAAAKRDGRARKGGMGGGGGGPPGGASGW
jgi:hypothetical protein